MKFVLLGEVVFSSGNELSSSLEIKEWFEGLDKMEVKDQARKFLEQLKAEYSHYDDFWMGAKFYRAIPLVEFEFQGETEEQPAIPARPARLEEKSLRN